MASGDTRGKKEGKKERKNMANGKIMQVGAQGGNLGEDDGLGKISSIRRKRRCAMNTCM